MKATATQREEDHVDERTQPPFLSRVRIKGYKSIAFCDVPLQPLTILVGRNGAGKSNFLDALAFLRDIMETNVTEAVKRRGGWSSLLCHTSDASSIELDIEAGFDWQQPQRVDAVARYRLRLVADSRSHPTIAEETLTIQCSPPMSTFEFEVTAGVVRRWHSTADTSHPESQPHSSGWLNRVPPDRPLLSLIGDWPFVRLNDGFRFMGFYNFHPAAIRRVQQPIHGMLEPDGSNLAGAIVALKEIDKGSIERIRDYLTLINEDVRGFDVASYGDYETVRFDLKPSQPAKTLCFDATGMSDGTLRALATLVAAFQINLPIGPDVVGIEEPETSLHPAAMRALVDAMDEAMQRKQILLTTHSADLLSGRDLTPGQVLVVRNRAGQTHITPVDPASRQIIEKELYSLADLQRMDQLALDEADLKRQASLSNGAQGG